MIGAIADLYVRLSADTSPFRRGLEFVGQDIDRTENNITRAGARMQSAGKAMTLGLTVPTVALGAAAVKMSLDFESAFAGVEKTVEGTDAQMAQLRQGILDMATEIPASREEIAGVAEAAGQLGISTPNILGFTRVMIDMGNSTNLSAQDAANALARLANITQMPQDEFDRLGSTVVHLGNKLATTEAEIVEMGMRIAGAGDQIGLTEAEILGFAGALSSVGINAEAGGTAISRVFKEIAVEVETGGESLHQFAAVAGMSVEEFSTLFEQDAAGAIVAFIEGLATTEERGMSAIAVLEQMGITEVRMSDALLRSAGAGDLLRESIEMGNEAWEENNALTEEAARRYDTNASKMQVAMNRVTEAGRQIGDVLVPMVATAADFIADLATAFASLPAPVQGGIMAIVGIAAAIGPLLWVTGSLITNYKAIKTVAPQMAAAVANAFRMMAASHPVLLAVTAATAALLAVWTLVSMGGRDNTRVVGELTDAMREQNDVVGASTQAWLRNQLTQTKHGQELVGMMSDLGMTFEDLDKALQAGGPELDALKRRLMEAAEQAGWSEIRVAALGGGLETMSEDAKEAAAFWGDLKDVEGEAVGPTADLEAATGELANELGVVGEEAETAQDALEDWQDAQRAAVDPLFALIDATRGNQEAIAAVTEAQRALNDAYASGDPAAIAKAQRDLEAAHQAAADSALELDMAEQALLQSIQEQPGFLQSAIDKVNEWEASGRITSETADAMREKFTLAALAAMSVPDEVHTRVQVEGAEGAVAAIQSVINSLAVLAASNATAAIRLALGQRAAGGPTSAMVPYLVEENGPEIMVPGASGSVIPSHQLGNMFARGLSAAAGGDGVGMGMGGGGLDYDRLGRAVARALRDEPPVAVLDTERTSRGVGDRQREIERSKK